MGKPTKVSDRNAPWYRPKIKRQYRNRAFRKYFLIVCEGTRTEPNYFVAISKALPLNVIELDIQGEGANTLSLVQRAREIRDSRAKSSYPFDEVWVVFDKDSFPPHNFDNAIASAQADQIHCAWSNEAFELWYILHFEYRNTGMNRDEYSHCLTNHLGETYRKNDELMYRKLTALGDETIAIRNAKLLCQNAPLPPSSANPCTTVYLLVEELNKYKSTSQI
jgi:disulfide oxidoreductase YuzD